MSIFLKYIPDYDAVPPLLDVLLNPLEHGRLRIQVVYGDVEETLHKEAGII